MEFRTFDLCKVGQSNDPQLPPDTLVYPIKKFDATNNYQQGSVFCGAGVEICALTPKVIHFFDSLPQREEWEVISDITASKQSK